MATGAENLAKLQHVYAQWNESKGKNEQAWLDIMADDVRVRTLARGGPGVEFTTEMRSKAELDRYLTGLREEWQMIYYRADEFVVDGDKIAVMGWTAWTNRKTGRKFETPKADFAVFRDGKIVKWTEFYDTAAIQDALRPPEGAR
jgi:uncharacterized protein